MTRPDCPVASIPYCSEIGRTLAASCSAVAWVIHITLYLQHSLRYRYYMLIFIFASDTHLSVSAFTSDRTGGNLPTNYAPWRQVNGGRAMLVGSNIDPVSMAIQRDGYFLSISKARIGGRDQTPTGRGVH
jgi:hypothetical protein